MQWQCNNATEGAGLSGEVRIESPHPLSEGVRRVGTAQRASRHRLTHAPHGRGRAASSSIPFPSISIPFHSRPSQYITVYLRYIASHGRGVPGRRARRRRSARGASASSSAASTSKPRSVRVLTRRTVMQRSASLRDAPRATIVRARSNARRAIYARTRSSHLVSFNHRRM